ncbi:hypothetical protein IZY60_10995 [Lutibacter sp. B2]|nr:hypothetical protein [Lutibacter sp. B2]
MNVEFHYYITYLIAARAGFDPKEASIIAYASQYVDDNYRAFEISKGTPNAYNNYISQTMNILKPKKELFLIYLLFHFIPGDPMSEGAKRRDGTSHMLNTTPNSKNANDLFDSALTSKNSYRIGIATHSFADTWSHQNFVGCYDEFNSFKGIVERLTPNIGHADAYYVPDLPAVLWSDKRLVGKYMKIYNKQRVLDAARRMCEKLLIYISPTMEKQDIDRACDLLSKDLAYAIGKLDQKNRYKEARIKRYKELANRKEYGNTELKDYTKDEWFYDAVKLNTEETKSDLYNWKDQKHYKKSDWYMFQEAVKEHQEEAMNILKERNFKDIQLEKW